jgi:diguanylate cyclase (GGDEF)-like protein/PAS domain S-box-containing protein
MQIKFRTSQLELNEPLESDTQVAYSLSTAYDPLPTPILITNTEAKVLYINPAFTQLTGYKSLDLIGKNPRMLSAGRTPKHVYKELWNTILSGNIWCGELENRSKDGRVYLESIFIAPIKNGKGKIAHFVSSWQDITRKRIVERSLNRSRKVLKDASLRDELTGVYNRRGFLELMEHQRLLSRRQEQAIGLLYIDLDGFKMINDQYGHKVGDQAIGDTADIIRRTFRTSDIVARMGGDEFVVAAIDSEKEGLTLITRRLKENFDRYNAARGADQPSLKYSVGGVLVHPDEKADLGSLIEKADRLMYRHKKTRRSGR